MFLPGPQLAHPCSDQGLHPASDSNGLSANARSFSTISRASATLAERVRVLDLGHEARDFVAQGVVGETAHRKDVPETSRRPTSICCDVAFFFWRLTGVLFGVGASPSSCNRRSFADVRGAQTLVLTVLCVRHLIIFFGGN